MGTQKNRLNKMFFEYLKHIYDKEENNNNFMFKKWFIWTLCQSKMSLFIEKIKHFRVSIKPSQLKVMCLGQLSNNGGNKYGAVP